jgi:hypothetical protein
MKKRVLGTSSPVEMRGMPPDYTERASGIILKVNENYSVGMKLRG